MFDVDASKKLKNVTVPEKAAFWRWISDTHLGVVGTKSVYHIDITNESSGPQKIFERQDVMANCQIMNYEVDSTGKWCFVVGLYMDANKQLLSRIQLFNIDQGKTMPLEGYAACFGDMPVVDGLGSGKNQLFAFAMRKSTDPTIKLQITELSQDPSKAFKVNADIQLAPDAPGDIPIIMQACNKYGLIFLITKEGYFYMYEASTAALVYRQRLTTQPVQVAVRNGSTDGMICINKAGQILAINVDDQNLVKFIMSANHIQNNQQVAIKLAARFALPGADDSFKQQFNMCLAQSDYAGAARIAKDSPGTLLRNMETINKFKTLPP